MEIIKIKGEINTEKSMKPKAVSLERLINAQWLILCLLNPLPYFEHVEELRVRRRRKGATGVLSSFQGGTWGMVLSTWSLAAEKG